MFILFISLAVKLYIKRAVYLAQTEALGNKGKEDKIKNGQGLTPAILKKPIQDFVVNLKELSVESSVKTGEEKPGIRTLILNFLKKYRKFLIFLLLIIIWMGLFYFYFTDVLRPKKNFEVIQKNNEKTTDFVPPKGIFRTKD